MKTINTVMHQLTNANSIMQDLKDTLRKIDPVFSERETAFAEAAAALEQELGDSVSPSVRDYLAAMEENFSFSLIYIGWQGFQLNIDIFRNPVNALRLERNFEELHQERRLGTISVIENARRVIGAFYEAAKKLPDDLRCLTDHISAFYSYLETMGYKLAHYFAFRLGDTFLHYVIPGYTNDDVHTSLYTMSLQKYLNMNPSLYE